MSRGGTKISRVSEECEHDRSNVSDWLTDFATKISKKEQPKTAVEVARERNEKSLTDQLNAVMQRKSRHLTVDSVVQEMRERTGLNTYLKSISSNNDLKKKVSSIAQQPQLPKSLAQYKACANDMDTFIKTIINKFGAAGVTIPQVQHDLLKAFGDRFKVQPEDVWNQEVAEYINYLIASAQGSHIHRSYNPDLGSDVTEEPGPENYEAFSGLNPVKL